MNGFYIYNIETKKITKKYINEKLDYFNEFNGSTESFSPDQSQFFLVTKDKLILFNNEGKQLLEENFISFYDDRSDYRIESSFQLGSFISPNEIVYLEFGNNNKTDLHQFDQNTKKTTNLADKLGKVIQFQVSPDQSKVAVLSMDEKETKYSVNIINFQVVGSPKRIASFSYPVKYTDAFRFYPDLSLLFSFSWSNNSQFLYFVSSGTTQPQMDEKNATNSLVIYQVNADGSNLKPLTDLNGLSFQPSLSPDGKQMLDVYGEEQQLNLMNLDGTNKRRFNSKDKMTNCIRPLWSVDSNYVSFYQNTGVYQKEINEIVYNFLVVNKKKWNNKKYSNIYEKSH